MIRGNYFHKALNIEAPNVGFYLEMLGKNYILIASIYINLKYFKIYDIYIYLDVVCHFPNNSY